MRKILNEKKGVSLVSIIVIAVIAVIIIITVIKFITNGVNVLSKAQSAGEETRESESKEKLSLLLTAYKADDFLLKSNVDFNTYLENLKTTNQIENYWVAEDLAILKFGGLYFFTEFENKTWTVVGSVPFSNENEILKTIENYKLSISDNLNEQVTMENNGVYAISDLVKENSYNYYIPEKSEVTIIFLDDYEINNKNKLKPAIELGQESILNLYVYSNATVSSLYNGNEKIIYNNITSNSGFAGISVPVLSTLRIMGNGTLNCYGGPAGKGGTYSKDDYKIGAGGGRSWCWNWRKWRIRRRFFSRLWNSRRNRIFLWNSLFSWICNC